LDEQFRDAYNQSALKREKFKGIQPKSESTDAKNYGGTACSSEEVSIMEMEQRSSVKQVFIYYPT
jgi:hypothetical protein